MKMILAILFLAAVSAQDCASKIQEFGDCLAAAKAEVKDAWEGTYDFASCFTDNGCVDPKQARRDERECRANAVRDEVELDLSTCAADKGIFLPDGFFDMLGHGGRGHKGGRRGGKGRHGDSDERAEKIAEACVDTPDAVEDVAACLEEKRAAKRAEKAANRRSGLGRRQSKGGKFQECLALLAGCESEAEEQRAQLCECGQSLAEDQDRVDRVNAALQTCGTEEFGDSDDSSDSEDSDESDPFQRLLAKFCRSKGGRRGGPGGRRGDRRNGGSKAQRNRGSGPRFGKGRWNRNQ